MKENIPQLEELIETWELELSTKKSLTEDNVLELSSHLRDHVDELLERNLTEEEAFAIARYQMGESGEIEKEFEKVNDMATSKAIAKYLLFGVNFFFLFYFIGTIIINVLTNSILSLGVYGENLVSYHLIISLVVYASTIIWGIRQYNQGVLSRIKFSGKLLILLGTILLPSFVFYTYTLNYITNGYIGRVIIKAEVFIMDFSLVPWFLIISIFSIVMGIKIRKVDKALGPDYV